MIDMNVVAARLSNARREKGFTQEELAVRLGITSQAISKWERALSLPDIDLLLDVSKILDVSINFLIDTDIHEAKKHYKTVYDIPVVNLLEDIHFEQIRISFGFDIIPVFTEDYLQEFMKIRREYLVFKGVLLPCIRIMDDMTLGSRQCRIEVLNKVRYDREFQEITEEVNKEIISSLRKIIDANLFLFVNRHMVKLLIEKLKSSFPFCVEGVIPDRISLSKLKIILKTLVKDGHSISDLYTIIETIDDNIDVHADVSLLVKVISNVIS